MVYSCRASIWMCSFLQPCMCSSIGSHVQAHAALQHCRETCSAYCSQGMLLYGQGTALQPTTVLSWCNQRVQTVEVTSLPATPECIWGLVDGVCGDLHSCCMLCSEALHALNKAIQLNCPFTTLHDRGSVRRNLDDYAGARRDYKAALETFPVEHRSRPSIYSQLSWMEVS